MNNQIEQVTHQIKQLMIEFHGQIPNVNSISWYKWTNHILENGNPYYQAFYNLLNQLSEATLRQFYKNLRKPPTIIFTDIAKKFVIYHKKNTGVNIKVGANMSLNLIISLLAYTLVCEVVVQNYFTRIDERFGWI